MIKGQIDGDVFMKKEWNKPQIVIVVRGSAEEMS
jgi:hypothetical protein